jgi:hypothetical protein
MRTSASRLLFYYFVSLLVFIVSSEAVLPDLKKNNSEITNQTKSSTKDLLLSNDFGSGNDSEIEINDCNDTALFKKAFDKINEELNILTQKSDLITEFDEKNKENDYSNIMNFFENQKEKDSDQNISPNDKIKTYYEPGEYKRLVKENQDKRARFAYHNRELYKEQKKG